MGKEYIKQRFFANINKTSYCWNWTGTLDKVGLPNLKTTKKEFSARRLSLEYAGRELLIFKLHIFTKCNNRICVNPDHLGVGDEARFWSYVNKTDDCWFWTGCKDKNGYGKFLIKHGNIKKDIRVHRYSYELAHGLIGSESICVCHKCDNPPCVEPDHLFLGTHLVNALDRVIKDRGFSPEGSLNPNSKLNELKVKQIIDLYETGKYSCQDIATTFGVSSSNILQIIHGTIWKQIPRKSHEELLIILAKSIPGHEDP